MKQQTWNDLNSSDNEVSREAFINLLKQNKLKGDDLKKLFSLENKLIICNFLVDYHFFDKNDLTFITKYICENLDHPDKPFVSELIEFASSWNLELPYEKCLGFLGKHDNNDGDSVLLATINYVFENFKISFIDQIKISLDKILNNSEQVPDVQIMAAFVLFRITMNKGYLKNLFDLVIKEPQNREIFKNILSKKWNRKEYFDYNLILQAVLDPAMRVGL